jgi:hypothetical protein
MIINMPSENEHNHIQFYEKAVHALNKTPNNRELQHKAVLALARAGSTDSPGRLTTGTYPLA